ncbi:hypothetical protein C0992_005207 [Termitomyces sp. T32_za158]|nr:hypothetical protein C0992_005207 [Termitomyces sp. T32_za158]
MAHISSTLRAPLEDVQVAYCRQLLGLGSHSTIAPLFTELGLMPIFHRRAILVLRYLIYISKLSPSHYAQLALADSVQLAVERKASWVADLVKTLAALAVPQGSPIPVELTGTDIWDADRLQRLIDEVKTSCDMGLCQIITTSSKLSLMRKRLVASDTDNISKFRHYLEITTPAYRKAFTKLVISNHALGVEVLHHTHRYRTQPVP